MTGFTGYMEKDEDFVKKYLYTFQIFCIQAALPFITFTVII